MRTLYGMSSPNVRKVLIALEELELAYDWRHVGAATRAILRMRRRRTSAASAGCTSRPRPPTRRRAAG